MSGFLRSEVSRYWCWIQLVCPCLPERPHTDILRKRAVWIPPSLALREEASDVWRLDVWRLKEEDDMRDQIFWWKIRQISTRLPFGWWAPTDCRISISIAQFTPGHAPLITSLPQAVRLRLVITGLNQDYRKSPEYLSMLREFVDRLKQHFNKIEILYTPWPSPFSLIELGGSNRFSRVKSKHYDRLARLDPLGATGQRYLHISLTGTSYEPSQRRMHQAIFTGAADRTLQLQPPDGWIASTVNPRALIRSGRPPLALILSINQWTRTFGRRRSNLNAVSAALRKILSAFSKYLIAFLTRAAAPLLWLRRAFPLSSCLCPSSIFFFVCLALLT